MPSHQNVKNFLYSLSALGGTVAVIYTALFERPLEDQACLIAETEPNKLRPLWDSNWDRREPKNAVDENNNLVAQPRANRHLILIRHGQYNLKGQTDQERVLTNLGREQALLTGARLAELGLPYSEIVHSNMSRAIETAALIAKHNPDVPVKSADGILREGAPVRPDPIVGRWHPEYYYHVDGQRIEAAFRKYFHRADIDQEEDSFEVIVCHANVIRYFICRALQLPPEAWLRMSLKHASLTWITIRPDGRCKLAGLGDAGHLPPEKLTTS